MPVEEDVKHGDDAGRSETRADDESRVETPSNPGVSASKPEAEAEDGDVESPAPVHGSVSPTQLGTVRFVYAAYFAGAVAIAFMASKLLGFGWERLESYKPMIGDPRDEIIMPVSAVAGAGAAFYFWYRTRARELAEEVASEMSKVTWPTRTEVTNGTFVVIVTTIISVVFFALMDKFWGFITNLVYGGI